MEKNFAYIPYDPAKETPEQALQRAKVMDDSGRMRRQTFEEYMRTSI